MIKVKKEGKYLSFRLEDGKEVKYDLSDNSTISPSGNKVQTISKYFAKRQLDEIIESVEEGPYKEWLKYAQRHYYSLSNLGSLLKKLSRKPHIEQMILSGVKFSANPFLLRSKKVHPTLAKVLKEKSVSFNDDVAATFEYLGKNRFELAVDCGSLRMISYYLDEFKELVTQHNYDVARLIEYLAYLRNRERVMDHYLVVELLDYASQASVVIRDWERYPRFFLSKKAIVDSIYNKRSKEWDEVKYQKAILPELDKKVDDYLFIYPKTTEEIRQEGYNQGHCVASYIEGIIEKKRHVIFMRENPNESLITIELSMDLDLKQCEGKHRREPSEREQQAIDRYVKAIKKARKKK